MSTNVLEVNDTTSAAPNLDIFGNRHMALIYIAASAVTVLGSIGNYLSFQSAAYLPEATTKYLMRYLAVFDTLTSLMVSVGQHVLYNFIFRRIQVETFF